jgi:hypothetical protein
MVLRMLAQPWPVSPRPCKKIIEAETEDHVRHTCGFHCVGSGSGSRRAKMAHKNKKNKKIHVLKCLMFSYKGGRLLL